MSYSEYLQLASYQNKPFDSNKNATSRGESSLFAQPWRYPSRARISAILPCPLPLSPRLFPQLDVLTCAAHFDRVFRITRFRDLKRYFSFYSDFTEHLDRLSCSTTQTGRCRCESGLIMMAGRA
jgi:hypothetical protein